MLPPDVTHQNVMIASQITCGSEERVGHPLNRNGRERPFRLRKSRKDFLIHFDCTSTASACQDVDLRRSTTVHPWLSERPTHT